jgi:hypothetical protein
VALDPSVIVAVLALVSSLGGIVVANRFTARTARQAQETTADIERKKLDASSWQDAVKLWKDDVMQLRKDREEDSVRHETEVIKLQSRLESMEDELRVVNRRGALLLARDDAMVAWSRVVVTIMREAGIVFPPPPPGVAETNPGITPIV